MPTSCPYVENKHSVQCFASCKAERLEGQWKICVGSAFDPLPDGTIEVTSTGLTDISGNELFEIYQSRQYWGSCYAASAKEAESKAIAGQLLELTAS